jgi:predicted Zn-dependent protease/mRNA-degrading endonuclease HigB of HigAB toxin-antitoxin module
MTSAADHSQFTVAILPLGDIYPRQIEFTDSVLKIEFKVNTIILPKIKIPEQYFDAENNCFRSRQILDFLFSQLPKKAQRIMGITENDLRSTNGQVACAGLADICCKTAVYKIPTNRDIIYQDASTYHLIAHELGHTLYLKHCNKENCAMNDNEVNPTFCENCQKCADYELKIRPGSLEDMASLAEALLHYRYFHQAASVYRKIISSYPHEPLYYQRLSIALNNEADKKEATKALADQSTELDNNKVHLYYNLGLIYLKTDPEKAKKEFANAIMMARDKKFIHKIIGQAYRLINHDAEKTSLHYQEYLRLGGDDQDVIDWLISRNQLPTS